MANLKVKIVLRLPASQGRGWIEANGKADPPGTYYLRFYASSRVKHERVEGDFHEAELALLRKERKLLAHSQGFVLPDESKPENAAKLHRIPDVITAYHAELRENRRPEKSVRSQRTELEEFAKFCGKSYVEEIDRRVLIAYRNHLFDQGKAEVTVLNKLMSVCTWLKKNTVVPVVGLLRTEDWPERRDTEPHPYTENELNKMFAAARPEEHLLVRFFLATGMREQEVAHAEFEDINYEKKFIQVQPKPEWGWSPKTEAGTRKIPLGDALLTDLSLRGASGLIFPNKNTKRPGAHFLRIIRRAIAERAGVEGAGCHRWRDIVLSDVRPRYGFHFTRNLASPLQAGAMDSGRRLA
jgi:integrase